MPDCTRTWWSTNYHRSSLLTSLKNIKTPANYSQCQVTSTHYPKHIKQTFCLYNRLKQRLVIQTSTTSSLLHECEATFWRHVITYPLLVHHHVNSSIDSTPDSTGECLKQAQERGPSDDQISSSQQQPTHNSNLFNEKKNVNWKSWRDKRQLLLALSWTVKRMLPCYQRSYHA